MQYSLKKKKKKIGTVSSINNCSFNKVNNCNKVRQKLSATNTIVIILYKNENMQTPLFTNLLVQKIRTLHHLYIFQC